MITDDPYVVKLHSRDSIVMYLQVSGHPSLLRLPIPPSGRGLGRLRESVSLFLAAAGTQA